MKLLATLENQLRKGLNFFSDNGELKKWVCLSKAQNFDEELIGLLLENSELKEKFFIKIKDSNGENNFVFNLPLFSQFLEQKNYLNDSYTTYKNKIGLTIDGKFLKQRNEVSLVWPFKDCILEGGQSTEEQKREEVFFNEILAQDEITQLLEPKVLTAAKKFTQNGEEEFQGFSRDETSTIKDNLIIKGNNLLALHSLKKEFAGKVKLIYIDPPYNTGNDGFKYNDNFNHSSWLTFMRNRLEVARELLREDGVIFVQCDDNEQAYLKVLMDEVFGRENFVSNIIHNNKYTISNDSRWTSKQCEFVAIFAKNKEKLKFNLLDRTEEMDNAYKNPDNDQRGVYKLTPLHAKSGSENGKYQIIFKNGMRWIAPEGRFPRYAKQKLTELDKDNRIYFGKDGNGSPNVKTFLSEVKNGKGIGTFWSFKEAGSSHQANEELANLLGKGIFGNPKPENLLKIIIQISTQPNDIILDFHLGSGTAAAVAHKMNRQYIGIEQMDYIETIAVERLKKVIGSGEKRKITAQEKSKLEEILKKLENSQNCLV